jgi:simple sugar transport system permease protein
VGENPLVADSLGINVYRIRFFGVIMSGVLAGLGGAYLSIGQLSQFGEKMAAGRGFIALAAMIFGKWHPSWALGACIFFGFGYALADSLQSAYRVSPEISFLFLMIPFVITMIVLAGVVGKAVPPVADGIPYEKEE